MKTLKVELGERSYDILIGKNLLPQLEKHVGEKVFIVTDENVAKLHLETLQNTLNDLGVKFESKILPAGEATKSFAKLEEVTDWLLQNKIERSSTLIAFGGGVIGDLVGFAASVALRGINFIQIPTSLLSQVDSSVGGKTAINSKFGKNLVGAFYQPKLVIADISLLKTLPKREFLSGYAEVIKYGLINDLEFFNWLDANPLDNDENISEAVYRSCKSKAEIVAQDEREGGVRALLNLGHTFGHAYEAETGFCEKLLHGEGVALGMCDAFDISVKLGFCDEQDALKAKAHFEKVGLPIRAKNYLDEWNIDELISHMYSDKKVANGKLVFILTKGIGKAFIAKDIDENEVREFLADR